MRARNNFCKFEIFLKKLCYTLSTARWAVFKNRGPRPQNRLWAVWRLNKIRKWSLDAIAYIVNRNLIHGDRKYFGFKSRRYSKNSKFAKVFSSSRFKIFENYNFKINDSYGSNNNFICMYLFWLSFWERMFLWTIISSLTVC